MVNGERTGRVQAVTRSIDVLLTLCNGPRRLSDVTRATGLSKGTVFRLLQTLSYRALVFKDPETDLYMLGPGALRLMHGVLLGLGGVVAGKAEALQRLRRETDETVAVHVRLGLDRVCVYELPSLNPLRYTVGVGATTPLHAGAAGKAILAMLPDDEVDLILRRLGMPRVTEHTIDTPAVLLQELTQTRQRGYALSIGEVVPGACAISVGFTGADGTIACVSVYGPATRIPAARYEKIAGGLQRAARVMRTTFGSPGGDHQDPVVPVKLLSPVARQA